MLNKTNCDFIVHSFTYRQYHTMKYYTFLKLLFEDAKPLLEGKSHSFVIRLDSKPYNLDDGKPM